MPMGFISDLASKPKQYESESRQRWNRIFGATDKETPSAPAKPNTGGGSWARSASNDAAYLRFLRAMQSKSPGGWITDKFTESGKWQGIPYACGHRLCEYLSMSEFGVFVKDDNHQDGKRPVRKDEEGYKLNRLLEKPNPEDSWGDLAYDWLQQMLLHGESLTWMVNNVLKVPYQLFPIPTPLAIPQPVMNDEYPEGYYRIMPMYPYGPYSSSPTPNTSSGAAIDARQIMRFKWRHPLFRYAGYSPLTAMRMHLDELEAMDRSRWYTMQRTINPSAILNFDEMEGAQALPEAEIERIRADFENTHQGPENHGRLYVATPGAHLDPWTANLHDLEYHDGWEQLASFAMAGFGITKPAAGMIEDSSYSTLFATLKQLYEQTLDPICHRFGQKLTRQLAPYFGEDLIVEVKCKRIDDHELKERKLRLAMEAGVLKKNGMLRELDMPITKEEWGDEFAGQPSQPAGGVDPMTGQPMQPGMDPNANGQQVDPQTGQPIADEPEAPEVSQTRPTPGPLGEGSLGPRKSLRRLEEGQKKLADDVTGMRRDLKSLRTRYSKRFSVNGNGRH